jgi:hypothetical protein
MVFSSLAELRIPLPRGDGCDANVRWPGRVAAWDVGESTYHPTYFLYALIQFEAMAR